MTNLEELDLSHNQIEEVPSKIGNLIGLQELHLSDNQIETIPCEIENLSNLRELDLSNNKIKDFSYDTKFFHSLDVCKY